MQFKAELHEQKPQRTLQKTQTPGCLPQNMIDYLTLVTLQRIPIQLLEANGSSRAPRVRRNEKMCPSMGFEPWTSHLTAERSSNSATDSCLLELV